MNEEQNRQLLRVKRRLVWAEEDIQKAGNKLLTLLSGKNIDRALWEEISRHLADAQSHLHNARQLLPEVEESK